MSLVCFYPPPPQCQSSADAPYIARHVGLRCGIPIPVPALTVNRLCGSGFQSIINGAQVSTPTGTKNILAETQMLINSVLDSMAILLDPPIQSNELQYNCSAVLPSTC